MASSKYQLLIELMVVHVQYISDEIVIEGGYHYKLLVSAGSKFKQPYFFK